MYRTTNFSIKQHYNDEQIATVRSGNHYINEVTFY